MAEIWTSIQDAAERLGVSTRTVERRAKAGDLASRLTPSGRREVRIDTEPTPADNWSDSLSVLANQSERQLQIAASTVDATRQLSAAYQGELKRARRVGLVAWLTVAALVAAIGAGTWWTARTLTATEGRLETEQATAKTLGDRLEDTSERLIDTEADLRAERATTERLKAVIDAERAAQAAKPAAWRAWLARLTP